MVIAWGLLAFLASKYLHLTYFTAALSVSALLLSCSFLVIMETCIYPKNVLIIRKAVGSASSVVGIDINL